MRFVFFALMALAVAPQVHAAVTLHVSSTTLARAGATQMDVTLADTYMAVDTAQGRLVYDFPARRRYAINTAAGEFVEYSLFDTLGFRVMEMRNRDVLRGALAASQVAETPAMSKHLHENELSLLSGAPERQVRSSWKRCARNIRAIRARISAQPVHSIRCWARWNACCRPARRCR